MIDHVTYEVSHNTMETPELPVFMNHLGLGEVEPDQKIEKDWTVRWFQARDGFSIHLVEHPKVKMDIQSGLGHFCAVVSPCDYEWFKDSPYEDKIGSGEDRIWVSLGPIRAEVRKTATPLAASVDRSPAPIAEATYDEHSGTVLEEAIRLTGGPRAEDYGDALVGAHRWAEAFGAITGIHEIRAEHFPVAMVCLKLSRLSQSENNFWHRDSWVDIAGYARVAELMEEEQHDQSTGA